MGLQGVYGCAVYRLQGRSFGEEGLEFELQGCATASAVNHDHAGPLNSILANYMLPMTRWSCMAQGFQFTVLGLGMISEGLGCMELAVAQQSSSFIK